MPSSNSSSGPEQGLFYRIASGVAAGGFGLGIALFAYLGFFSRYYADDYCFAANFVDAPGFLQSQLSYYEIWSPRFMTTLVISLSEFLGPSWIFILPLTTVLLWVAGGIWLASRLPIRRAAAVLSAEAMVFFVLLEAPNRYQSLYWRPGMVTYLMPLVLLTWLTGWLLHVANRAPRRPGARAGALALTAAGFFVAGGFSETTVALQVSALGLALVLTLPGVALTDRESRAALLPHLLTALIASLLAMTVLIVAPGNQIRLASMPAQPDPLSLVGMSLRYAGDFLVDSLRTLPLPIAFSALTSFLIFWGAGPRPASRPFARTARPLIGLPVIAYLLIVSICAPSAYAESAYPEDRALLAACLIMTAGIIAEAGLLGSLAADLTARSTPSRAKWLEVGAMGLLLVTSAYPLRTAWQTSRLVPDYRQRAAAWDARDAQIRQARSQGLANVSVPIFDSLGHVKEIDVNPDHWVNKCAADYYGLESISGVLP